MNAIQAKVNHEQSAQYTQEFLNALCKLDCDESSRRQAWRIMEQSDSYWQGHPSYIDFLPRFYTEAQRQRFADVAHTTYRILAKVMKRFKSDVAYREEFNFDPRVIELMLLPQRFAEPLPFARVDFFYNEQTDEVRFCEFNADASSGMEESRAALRGIAQSPAFAAFTKNHRMEHDFDELFEGWVRTFLEIYRSCETSPKTQSEKSENRKQAQPTMCSTLPQEHMAIAVCFDSEEPEFGELEIYRKLFEKAGMPCSIFDVRELSYENGQLVGHHALAGQSNVVISCIWRYCLIVDLLEHWDDVQGFLDAIRNDACVMIGSFATHLVHDKQLFAVLHRPATSAFLDDDEQRFIQACIPYTAFLDDESLDIGAIKQNPSKWIIKPTDWYSSINVFAGQAYELDEWSAIVDKCITVAKTSREQGNLHNEVVGSPYLVQEFCEPYRTPAIPLYGREEDFSAAPKMYGNLLGLFVFAGHFAGMFSRLGPGPVITEAQGGCCAPTLWVTD